ncbi:MAG: hypothetical protein JOY93_00745 [Acidobacteriales bacterium]|nr:hypothetical protein [Terriglobales bacterium]
MSSIGTSTLAENKVAPKNSNSGLTEGQPSDASRYRDPSAPWQAGPKQSGFGLPCAKCKLYYPANLAECPTCKSTERVSPNIKAPVPVVPVENLPDPAALEEERERFLREFQAQTLASQLQINATTSMNCTKTENHQGGLEPATVCQSCYDHLQERVEALEGALHIDLTEAAEIVYDAVWADSTDSGKTYLNAAQALLSELRKRSGSPQVFGPLQPMLQ